MDAVRHFPREFQRPEIVHLLRHHENAELPSGGDGIGLLHAGEIHGDTLQFRQALDVILHGVPPGAGPGGRDHVRGGYDVSLRIRIRVILVVGAHGVDHPLIDAVLLQDLHADLHMRALHLVIDGFAEVMEQRRFLGDLGVQAQFRRDHGRDIGHFDGVGQHVLAVAGPKMKPAQELDYLFGQVVYPHLHGGRFADLLDPFHEFRFGLLHLLFDLGRLDAPVLHELLQRDARYFPAIGIERGNDDGIRGLVYDEFHAGRPLQGPDVAAFPADYLAFDLLVVERKDGGGHLGDVGTRITLKGHGDDVQGLLLYLVPPFPVYFLQYLGQVLGIVLADLGHKLRFGLVPGKSSYALQFFRDLVLLLGYLRLPALQLGGLFPDGGLAFAQGVQSFIETDLPLQESCLQRGDLVLAFLFLFLGFREKLRGLFLGRKDYLLGLGFRLRLCASIKLFERLTAPKRQIIPAPIPRRETHNQRARKERDQVCFHLILFLNFSS